MSQEIMPIYLGVNVDHVATIRQARGTHYPQPVHAAAIAERAGADGITVHLREDRRHIQDQDVDLLAHTLDTRLNLEIGPTDEMVSIAERIKPAWVCFVPEKREELTTEGGLDVVSMQDKLTKFIARLQVVNVKVSIFIEPDKNQIKASEATGADAVELHTGAYAESAGDAQQKALDAIAYAAHFAYKHGLIVNAGHGLHYHNVKPIAAIPEIHELNIGHAIVARAVLTGLEEAVNSMKCLMVEARGA